MYNKGKASGIPSDAQSKEKLAIHVYEYLIHVGAPKTANSFLQEIRWDKPVPIGEAPGFLHSWWSIFWDLYSAAPERRDSHDHSSEAKAFHDYGFVNTGFPNGLPHPTHGIPPGPQGPMPPPGSMDCGPRGPQGSMMPNQRPNVNPGGPHPGLPPHSHPMHPGMRFPAHPGMPGAPPMHRLPPHTQRWPVMGGGPPPNQGGGPPTNNPVNMPPGSMLHSQQPHPGIAPSPGHPGTPGGHGPPPSQSPSAHSNTGDAHFPVQTPPTIADSMNGPPQPNFIGGRPSPHPPMDFAEPGPHMMNGGGPGRIMPPPEYSGPMPVDSSQLKQSPSLQSGVPPHDLGPDFPGSQQNGRGNSDFVPNGPTGPDHFMSGGPLNGGSGIPSNGAGPVHFPNEY